jgi:hypothetical protein
MKAHLGIDNVDPACWPQNASRGGPNAQRSMFGTKGPIHTDLVRWCFHLPRTSTR